MGNEASVADVEWGSKRLLSARIHFWMRKLDDDDSISVRPSVEPSIPPAIGDGLDDRRAQRRQKDQFHRRAPLQAAELNRRRPDYPERTRLAGWNGRLSGREGAPCPELVPI